MKLSNSRGWDLKRAMRHFDIHSARFPKSMRGKAAGCSYTDHNNGKTYLSIAPEPTQENRVGDQEPIRDEVVAFHELGHILLGHTKISAKCQQYDRPDVHQAHISLFEVDAMKVCIQVALRLGIPDSEAHYDSIQYYIDHYERRARWDRPTQPLYTPASNRQISEAAEQIVAAGL